MIFLSHPTIIGRNICYDYDHTCCDISLDIPLGAKATKRDILHLISVKAASNIVMCITNMSQAIRGDRGTMWLKFRTEKVLVGVTIKKLMQEKDELKYPPAYYSPGAPHK
jgi:hypothetical protein